jgi:hypothetical protein
VKKFYCSFLLTIILIALVGCKAFMHGYTWTKAENAYNLITGDKNNFGDKRLVYNKGFHKKSALGNFLSGACNNRGMPDFIYEYKSNKSCRGIKLFYVKLDSVFVFEEPKKNNLNSIQKEARKIEDAEKQAYEKLKQKK